MKRSLVILFLLIFLLGCGPYIWFKVPQPEGYKDLDSFSETLLGRYLSIEDSSIIRIESSKIIKEYNERLIMSKKEFREEIGDSISNDTSFIFADNWDIQIKDYGDSVKVFSQKEDELFAISEDNLLRKFKQYYFLNFKDTNDYWKVKILRFENDTLEYDHLLTEDDIKNIKNLTTVEVLQDTTEKKSEYYLKPSKRELKKILKKRISGEKYIKIQ